MIHAPFHVCMLQLFTKVFFVEDVLYYVSNSQSCTSNRATQQSVTHEQGADSEKMALHGAQCTSSMVHELIVHDSDGLRYSLCGKGQGVRL